MQSEEIRKRFLDFFEKRGHKVLPSASLVPENDPSVLFNTAGMQPLVPYLLGEKHPAGNRLVDSQKCVRTQDIEEVGDNTHNTFFEMLGNWSLGDYFKKEALNWSYEFLVSQEEGLGLDIARLYVTVFEGDENAPKDEESFMIWKEIFEKAGLDPEKRIFFMPAESNWWSPGDNGPCGPDSEMFYNVSEKDLGGLTKEEFIIADDKQQIVEIWNNVFMEYEKKDGKIIGKLKEKNVDTGAGLERITTALQKKDNIFDTDLFDYLIAHIEKLSNKKYVFETGDLGFEKKPDCWNETVCAMRILADHIRTAVFIISDGVVPSNTDRGYILRRILRRAVRYADQLGVKEGDLVSLADLVIEKYKNIYINLEENRKIIKDEIQKEEERFRKTLAIGLKQFEKETKWMGVLDEQPPKKAGSVSGHAEEIMPGNIAFKLFTTYGFPIEMTLEIAKEKNISVDIKGFNEEMKKHQELSRSGAEQKFKGGLANHDQQTVGYHTATHLLQQALIDVLGDHIKQKGANLTSERLRFDFSHPEKLTDEEKQKIEDLVNKNIQDALPVVCEEMTVEEAKKLGAIGVFDDKYEEKIKVYKIGDTSIEICGGPHIDNTKELGIFKIKKEQSISAGVRRIKAVLIK